MTKKRFSKKPLNIVAKLALLSLVAFLLTMTVTMSLKINDIRDKIDAARLELEKRQFELAELESRINAEWSEETIRKIARENLNLRDPQDMIFANDLPN